MVRATRVASGTWPGQDNAGADQADHSAGKIPAIGTVAFDRPKPKNRRNDVDAAIRRIGAAGGLAINQRQEIGEGREG